MSESTETTETSEPTDLEIAIGILEPLIEAGKSEDDMGVALIVTGGFKLSRAGNLVKAVLEAKGIKLSTKERNAVVSQLLTNGEFSPTSWEDVDAAAVSISEENENISKNQALSAIRKFAKDNEIELPTKPKGEGGTRSNIFDRFYIWAVENVGSEDDFGAAAKGFVESFGCSEGQAKKYTPVFEGILKFAKASNL